MPKILSEGKDVSSLSQPGSCVSYHLHQPKYFPPWGCLLLMETYLSDRYVYCFSLIQIFMLSNCVYLMKIQHYLRIVINF